MGLWFGNVETRRGASLPPTILNGLSATRGGGAAHLVEEIVDELPLAQATVSQHLKALKEVGFVQGEIEGPRTCYCLDWNELQRYREAVNDLFDEMSRAAATCC